MPLHHNAIAGFLEQVRQFAILLAIVFLIRTFGFGFYQVPTGSMETTMLVGDRFLADKFSYLFIKPKNGDIVAFNDPSFPYSPYAIMRIIQEYISIPYIGKWPSNWTKRLIGRPGDEIKGTIENGKPVIYRNGQKLDEPYVNKYPLIGIMKMSEVHVSKVAEKEALELISQRRLDPGDFAQFVAHRMHNYIDWRSYDPSMPYDKQPFHKMYADRILKDREGQPLLKLPDSPNRVAMPTAERERQQNYWNGSDEFYVKLENNQYWVMGDNRQGSKDSRYLGPIDGRLIHGRIFFRIFSIDGDDNWWIIDLLKHPIEFWTRVRWSRFLQSVA